MTDAELAGAPDYSIIITCYFEEQSIDEFYTRLSASAEALGRSYEIVLVNDGSTDATLEKLKGFFERDSHVTTVIDLFRNAGQAAAMTAGLCHARGKALVFMDSDLQLDPEDLPTLIQEFEQGYDVVSGYRENRRDPFLRKVTSKLANIVLRRVAGHALSDFGCTYKIFDAKPIRAFELGPFKPWRTAYIFSRVRSCKEVPVNHHPRRYGESGWTLKQLWSFYMDHLVGVSERPFQLVSLACIALAGLFLARLALAWTVDFSILSEVTPGLLLNALFLHLLVTLAVLSAIGEFVIRNFGLLQRYPAYVVRELLRKGESREG